MVDDIVPPITEMPIEPKTKAPYPLINGYIFGRLAPELQRHYRAAPSRMQPNTSIYSPVPSDRRGAVMRDPEHTVEAVDQLGGWLRDLPEAGAPKLPRDQAPGLWRESL